MSKYSEFVRKTVSISEASKIAQAWKTAAPATRKAACKHNGYETVFPIFVEGTRTTFAFYADGRVVTINAKPQSRYTTPKHLDMDYSKPVIGFTHGRPIYA